MISLLRDLERLLFPNSCITCRRLISSRRPDDLVCDVCVGRWRPVQDGPRACPRCNQPVPPVGPCRFCEGWPEALRRVETAVWLDETVSTVLHSMKYESRPRLAELATEVMTKHLTPPPGEWVILPVPTSARRIRDRGYDQAQLIARALARAWGLPWRNDVLVRAAPVRSQTALTPDRRLANVARAYCAALPAPNSPRALLVDDVMTTGATLMAAAEALAEAGWTTLHGVTFARAETFERSLLTN